ncbi:hypothetical protein Tco_1355243 [Tanacetum coccineum]
MEMCYLVNDGFDLHLDERKLFRVSYVLKTKNRHVDDAPLDKRRKLGTGRVMASTTSSQGRQALAPVTTNQKEVAAASSEAQEKQDWMRDYLKRLKVCIKWFQKSLEDLAMEKDNLRNMLDSSERNCVKAGFVKQREVAVKEVRILRVRIAEQNIGCTVAEVDKLSIKSSALEETCSSHRYQISILQRQLAANQKLKPMDKVFGTGDNGGVHPFSNRHDVSLLSWNYDFL